MSTLLTTAEIESRSGKEPDTDGTLTIQLFDRWEALESLLPEWNAILVHNPRLTIFSTPEWLGSWWQAYTEGKELRVFAFRDSHNKLVALVPLYLHRVRSAFFPSFNELRLVGDGSQDSDNLDFISLPGVEDSLARALFQHLSGDASWAVCQINCAASDSPAVNSFLNVARDAGWRSEISTTPWSAVELPETWELYLKTLSAKERGKVGNRLRRLEKLYQTNFYKCASLDQLPACLEALFTLHQKRWTLRAEPGTFASSERRSFYQHMARHFLSRGWLELWIVELNGTPVGAQYAFRYGNSVYSLQEGFDPDYSSDSVGYVLRSYVLRELITSGVRRYEFLAGEGDSKERWGGSRGTYLNVALARRRSAGSLYLSLARTGRASKVWARKVLPEPAANFLRSIRRKFRSA